MTSTSLVSYVICCFHVFLGLTPGCAKFMPLLAPLFSSCSPLVLLLFSSCSPLVLLLFFSQNHHRGPLRMTSSVGGRCSSRLIPSFRMCSSFDTPRILRSDLISVVTIFRLVVFITQHSFPYAGLTVTSYTFDFCIRGIFLSYRIPVFRQLDHAACTRKSTFLSI